MHASLLSQHNVVDLLKDGVEARSEVEIGVVVNEAQADPTRELFKLVRGNYLLQVILSGHKLSIDKFFFSNQVIDKSSSLVEIDLLLMPGLSDLAAVWWQLGAAPLLAHVVDILIYSCSIKVAINR